ncbi:MAG: hypothetical protein ABIQ36_03435 [Rhodanobacter sp.]
MPLSERAGSARSTGPGGDQRQIRAFLDYLLKSPARQGVDELASPGIADLLRIRQRGTCDARHLSGPVPALREAFIALQAHLHP